MSNKFVAIEDSLNGYYFERKDAIRAISVGLLSNLNIIMVGPPGTAKTDISKSYTSHIKDAKYFGTTMHPYTLPDEIFGALDLKLMKETGVMRRMTEGYLPTANIVAIEEIFKSGKGTLNSLIEVSHPSRLFSNGPIQEQTPIFTMIGTSNELPVGNKDLSAIYDRMIIKIYVRPLLDNDNFSNMVNKFDAYQVDEDLRISLKEVEAARKEAEKVKVPVSIIKQLVTLREELIKQGIHPSDRTFKLSLKALKAHAFLENRKSVSEDDMLFLRHMLWHEPDNEPMVRRVLMAMLKPELKRLNEILDTVDMAVKEVTEHKNRMEMIETHKKIQDYVKEAKTLRAEIVKKDRSVDECDDIIRKLKFHMSALGKSVLGEELGEEDNF